MTYTDLIAKLEAAPEGSRELDLAIAKHRYGPLAIRPPKRHYTTSLDAALTLVPEGWEWATFSTWQHRTKQPGAAVGRGPELDLGNATGAVGATPALALCIAALKARQAMEGAQ